MAPHMAYRGLRLHRIVKLDAVAAGRADPGELPA